VATPQRRVTVAEALAQFRARYGRLLEWVVGALMVLLFVEVTAGAQTIAFDPLANMTLGDPAVALHATASSGLTVTFESTTPSVCRIVNRKVAKVSAIGLGECEVVARQAGDGTYTAASAVQSFIVRAATDVTIVNARALSRTSTVVGESYDVSVQVSAVAPGTGVPTGTVTISDGTGIPGTCTATLTDGVGSCSLTSTSAGFKTITATYGGDPGFGPVTATLKHRVR